MSFYSALRLCANTGVDGKKCTAKALHALLEELDLLDPEASDEFGNMHPRLYDLFDDAIAGKENTRLFRPDTIGLETKIGIYSLRDQGWESDGYSISISGYGYFFPLELKDYRNLIEESSLSTLAERVVHCSEESSSFHFVVEPICVNDVYLNGMVGAGLDRRPKLASMNKALDHSRVGCRFSNGQSIDAAMVNASVLTTIIHARIPAKLERSSDSKPNGAFRGVHGRLWCYSDW